MYRVGVGMCLCVVVGGFLTLAIWKAVELCVENMHVRFVVKVALLSSTVGHRHGADQRCI